MMTPSWTSALAIKTIIANRIGRRLSVAARMVLVLLGIGAIGVPLIVGAQVPRARPEFDVASIRRSPASDGRLEDERDTQNAERRSCLVDRSGARAWHAPHHGRRRTFWHGGVRWSAGGLQHCLSKVSSEAHYGRSVESNDQEVLK
jgi:hypothetical protein